MKIQRILVSCLIFLLGLIIAGTVSAEKTGECGMGCNWILNDEGIM